LRTVRSPPSSAGDRGRGKREAGERDGMQEIEAADAPQWKLSRVKDILRGGGRKAIVVDDEENIVDAIEYGVQIEEIYCSEGYRPEMEATAEGS